MSLQRMAEEIAGAAIAALLSEPDRATPYVDDLLEEYVEDDDVVTPRATELPTPLLPEPSGRYRERLDPEATPTVIHLPPEPPTTKKR